MSNLINKVCVSLFIFFEGKDKLMSNEIIVLNLCGFSSFFFPLTSELATREARLI